MGITNLYTKEVRNKVEPRRTRKNCKTNESRKETKMMSYKQIVVAAVIAGMISFSVTVSTVVADVPSLMSYQGKLTDETGTDVPDGDYCMDFKIYDSPTNGIVLWSERQISVPVANGLFSVLLGSDQPIPDTVFNGQERWLGVALCGEEEMTPRHRITSVGYAFTANTDYDWEVIGDTMFAIPGYVHIGFCPTTGSRLTVCHGGGAVGLICEEDSAMSGIAVTVLASQYDTKVRGVKAHAIGSYIGPDILNLYGGHFYASGGRAVEAYGVYSVSTVDDAKRNWGVYAEASDADSMNYGIHAKVPTGQPGYVGYFEGDKSYFSGKVGVGTDAPSAKLDVQADSGTAVKGVSSSDNGSGTKYGGYFDALEGGDRNIGVFARGGCEGLPPNPGSQANIGIWAYDGTDGEVPLLPSGNYAGYFSGDVKITGSIKFDFDYDSGWFSISQGETVSLTHGLDGDETKYIVHLDGRSGLSDPIHQSNYGTASFRVSAIWYEVGCEWYDLTSDSIKVSRADDDNSSAVPENKQWDYARIRILKN